MKATDTRQIGRTSLEVTCLGLGGVFLARDAPRSEAEALIDRAYETGVRYFDTAPMYGLGESERRYRNPLARLDRSEFVLSTKVGRLLQEDVGGEEPWHFDFTRRRRARPCRRGDGSRRNHVPHWGTCETRSPCRVS